MSILALPLSLKSSSEDFPLRPAGARIGFPKADAAQVRITVMSLFGAFRQLAQFFSATAAQNDVIFDKSVIAIRQIAQFERKNHVGKDKGRAKAGAEPQKQHPSAMVTAERLQSGVIHDPDRFAQRLLEVESDPSFTEMFRLAENSAVP